MSVALTLVFVLIIIEITSHPARSATTTASPDNALVFIYAVYGMNYCAMVVMVFVPEQVPATPVPGMVTFQ